MEQRTAEAADVTYEILVQGEGYSYETAHVCMGCKTHVKSEWNYCPNCGAKLEFTGRIIGKGYAVNGD